MNILILGLGNMGGSIANALCQEHTIYAVEPNITHIQNNSAVSIFSTLDDAVDEINAEIDAIILTIKPQVLFSVLEQLAQHLSPHTLIISSVAGVEISTIARKLNIPELPIARIMPTIAAKKQKSMTGLSYNEYLSDTQRQQVIDIAQSLGQMIKIPESLMSAITGASGSGIAFVAKFIEAMTMAGVREGLSYQQSFQSTLQTMRGAIALLEDTVQGDSAYHNPSEFISSVCSPGGTTIEGIYMLEKHNFEDAIYEAVHAARIKSDSITSQSKKE